MAHSGDNTVPEGSQFCPYGKTSANYDLTRKPLGVSCTLGSFDNAAAQMPLEKPRLIDFGVVTGSFVWVVPTKLGTSTPFAYVGGMLREAKNRFGAGAENAFAGVDFIQGSADNMSKITDNSFEAATMNQAAL